MRTRTVEPCPHCGGFRFENGEARHAEWCPEPALQHPIYDGYVEGIGHILILRPGEKDIDFSRRLVHALLARGQGSEWQ